MTQEEIDAQVGRVYREHRDAEDRLNRLLVKLEGQSKLFHDLHLRLIQRKNTAATDWSRKSGPDAAYTSKAAEPVDFSPYRDILNVDALTALQEEITEARQLLFSLREQKDKLRIS
jgi:hypothetical protein